MTSQLSAIGLPLGNLFHNLAVISGQTDALLNIANIVTRSHQLMAKVCPKSDFVQQTQRLMAKVSNFERAEYASSLFPSIRALYDWDSSSQTDRLISAASVVAGATCWVGYGQLMGLIGPDVGQKIGSLSVLGRAPLSCLGKVANLPLHKSIDALGLAATIVALLGCAYASQKASVESSKDGSEEEANLVRLRRQEEGRATRDASIIKAVYYSLVLASLFHSLCRPVRTATLVLGIAAAGFGLRQSWAKGQVAHAEKGLKPANISQQQAAASSSKSGPLNHWVWQPAKKAFTTFADAVVLNHQGVDSQDKTYKLQRAAVTLLQTTYVAAGLVPPKALQSMSGVLKSVSAVINSSMLCSRIDMFNPYNPDGLLAAGKYQPADWTWWAKVNTNLSYAVGKLCEGAILCRDTGVLHYAYGLSSSALLGAGSVNANQQPLGQWFEGVKDLSTTLAVVSDSVLKARDLRQGKGDAWEHKLSLIGNVQKIFLCQYGRYLEKPIKATLPEKYQFLSGLLFNTVGIATALTLGYKAYYRGDKERAQLQAKLEAANV